MIIDDVYANISSANLNPRSFYVDTEIAAAWFDPGEVKKLRLRLWRELLGSPKGIEAWAPVDFVTEWTKIAEYNEKASIVDRRGLVIRHDESKFPGTKSSRIPDEFTEFLDLEAGNTDQERSAIV